jgi:hypothetical protein
VRHVDRLTTTCQNKFSLTPSLNNNNCTWYGTVEQRENLNSRHKRDSVRFIIIVSAIFSDLVSNRLIQS